MDIRWTFFQYAWWKCHIIFGQNQKIHNILSCETKAIHLPLSIHKRFLTAFSLYCSVLVSICIFLYFKYNITFYCQRSLYVITCTKSHNVSKQSCRSNITHREQMTYRRCMLITTVLGTTVFCRTRNCEPSRSICPFPLNFCECYGIRHGLW